MRVLGIDPGLAITGYAILDNIEQKMRIVDYGCIRTKATMDHVHRLKVIHDDLTTIIKTYRPDVAAVEKLFFNSNAKTALLVGEARGVVLLGLSLHDIPIFEYTPLQVKQAVVGYGRAEKQQVQQMVKTLLSLNEIPRPDDASDACAVSITHVQSYRMARF